MDKHAHHSGGGFGNGFLIGFIVGAAVIFFLFTKRGKELLRTITEEGIEGVEEFKELLDLDGNDEEYEESPREKVEQIVTKTETAMIPLKKTAKRFFRGVPKKR
jgi:hypothetical protein